MIIVEGVAGVWFYHLATEELPQRSLCGKDTMRTEIPLEAWGTMTHIGEKWCNQCEGIAKGKP